MRSDNHARHFISRNLEAVKAILRRQNLDAEFLEPTFQQLSRARIGVNNQYARRRRNLFEIVPALMWWETDARKMNDEIGKKFATFRILEIEGVEQK